MLLLHISDIHFKSPDCLDPGLDPERPYRTLMLRDVRAKVSELGSVGAILVGGDIAFKGASEEYHTALQWLSELQAVSGCPPERVFVVPGNHDVDRAIVRQTLSTRNTQAAIARANSSAREREFRGQISDRDTGRALLAPIAAYNDFAKTFSCQVYLPEKLYWKQDIDLGPGVVLKLHGLTSTILSGAEGKDDTRESLYLSPMQTVLDPVDNVVNLVLCHHPPSWLMDHAEADDAICERAAIQMFGHEHRQRIHREVRFVRFSAGAVNPDRDEKNWLPGYNFVDVQVGGEGKERRLIVNAHLRQWQSSPDMFRAVISPEGEEVFRHSIAFPGPEIPSNSLPVTPVVPAFPASVPKGAAANMEHGADGEAAMGDATTRNLVRRFWDLKSSERREIAIRLGLVTEAELGAPEPELYGRALIRASKEGKLEVLAREVAQKENH